MQMYIINGQHGKHKESVIHRCSCGKEALVFHDGTDYCMACWQASFAQDVLVILQN
jgi:hypothetical protein